MSRSEASPAPGRTRSVKVASLSRRHVGLEFVGLGRLERIAITAAGTRLLCDDGLDLLVRDDLQLDYYVTDEQLQRWRDSRKSTGA